MTPPSSVSPQDHKGHHHLHHPSTLSQHLGGVLPSHHAYSHSSPSLSSSFIDHAAAGGHYGSSPAAAAAASGVNGGYTTAAAAPHHSYSPGGGGSDVSSPSSSIYGSANQFSLQFAAAAADYNSSVDAAPSADDRYQQHHPFSSLTSTACSETAEAQKDWQVR